MAPFSQDLCTVPRCSFSREARSTPLKRVEGQAAVCSKDTSHGMMSGHLLGRQQGLVFTREEWRLRKTQAVHLGGEPSCLGMRPKVQAAILGIVCLMQGVGAGAGVGTVVTPPSARAASAVTPAWRCQRRKEPEEQSTS